MCHITVLYKGLQELSDTGKWFIFCLLQMDDVFTERICMLDWEKKLML